MPLRSNESVKNILSSEIYSKYLFILSRIGKRGTVSNIAQYRSQTSLGIISRQLEHLRSLGYIVKTKSETDKRFTYYLVNWRKVRKSFYDFLLESCKEKHQKLTANEEIIKNKEYKQVDSEYKSTMDFIKSKRKQIINNDLITHSLKHYFSSMLFKTVKEVFNTILQEISDFKNIYFFAGFDEKGKNPIMDFRISEETALIYKLGISLGKLDLITTPNCSIIKAFYLKLIDEIRIQQRNKK